MCTRGLLQLVCKRRIKDFLATRKSDRAVQGVEHRLKTEGERQTRERERERAKERERARESGRQRLGQGPKDTRTLQILRLAKKGIDLGNVL